MSHITETEIFNANLVRDAVINALLTEGMISEKDAIKFLGNYSVILTNKSWFRSVFDKLYKKNDDKDGFYYKVVKFIPNYEDIKSKQDNIDEDDSPEQLQFKLIQAEKNQNYELASILKKRIESLKK